jgi:hypothetical protein
MNAESQQAKKDRARKGGLALISTPILDLTIVP